eukprot:m.88735 g.88735  ORF g.88735 m.88735 type:complete len:396 (+) comp8815_c0_seq4:66-1253(+)
MTTELPRCVEVSAPGKLILHGEHAVVFGRTAVACSLDLRTTLKLRPVRNNMISLCLKSLDIDIKFPIDDLPECKAMRSPEDGIDLELFAKVKKIVEKCSTLDHGLESRLLAVEAFLYLYCEIVQPNKPIDHGVSIHIGSRLPIGAGLGSSAAFSVTMSAAMLAYVGIIEKIEEKENFDLINRWALLVEKIIHGNPSGLDNTMCCYGGAMKYVKGEFFPIDTFPQLDVVLINTQVPRSTKTLVSGVGDLRSKYPAVMEPLLNSFQAITEASIAACEKINAECDTAKDTNVDEHFRTLKQLITMNQHLLNAIGVGHRDLDKVVAKAALHGFSAKLTGAGGGGCAFILLHRGYDRDRMQQLLTNLEQSETVFWHTKLGGPGVSLEYIEKSDEEEWFGY